jgi:secretion/DNA translocation related TadE-like protein
VTQPLLASRDKGAGTVLMLGLAGAIVVAIVACLLVGAAVLAGSRAQSAADLGAIAGAQALLDGLGPEAACAAAGSVVQANGAELLSCVPGAERCEVVVAHEVSRAVRGSPVARAVARAVAGASP